jgi:uncharacterized protein (TIGR01777 family)
MKVFITGGTGFVGTGLVALLLERGDQVISVGTASTQDKFVHKNFRYISADTTRQGTWQDELARVDAVVNLTGRTIFKRWNERYKKIIRDSRILTTRNIVDALPENSNSALCSASAVGYYGSRGDDILTEDAPAGEGFLAEIGRQWEKEALHAAEKGIRVALMRFGIVLGRGGGAMAQMLPAFRMFVGGPLGDGKQWFPWIHIHDLTAAIVAIIEKHEMSGPFNFCAPNPVRNSTLAKTLGSVLGRPAFMPAPKIMLRLALGEFGSVLLESQRTVPQNLLNSGFEFKYPDLKTAIEEIVARPAGAPDG